MRNHWLIHCVISGTGILNTRAGLFTLGPGQVFILPPNTEHWYQADKYNPWKYQWAGFKGPQEDELAGWFGLKKIPLVVQSTPGFHGAFDELWTRVARNSTTSDHGNSGMNPPIILEQGLIAMLVKLFDTQILSQNQTHSTDPWPVVSRFLEDHSCEFITIGHVTKAGSVSKSELHRLCRKNTGKSVKEYITYIRMSKAKELLCDPKRPVSRIANLVGYREYQSFQRQFVRTFHMSPTQARMVWYPRENHGNK